jgi:hypothetical protein
MPVTISRNQGGIQTDTKVPVGGWTALRDRELRRRGEEVINT